jgi:peptidyl-Asp metalloendopeptidase
VPRKSLVFLSFLCSLSLLAAPSRWNFDPDAMQAQFDAASTRITIPAGDHRIELEVERTTRTAAGDLIVRARPVGAEFGDWAVLASSGGHWYGNVRSGERSYEIRHVANGVHEIVRNEDVRGPAQLPPMPSRRAPAPRAIAPDAAKPIAEAESVVVDVLMCYTSRLRSLVPEADIRNTANAAIEESNLAYERSGVSHRVRLAGLEEVTYDETEVQGLNSWITGLARMVDPADGFLDEMHTRRDALLADAVILMIGRNDACGYANLMTAPPSKNFAPEAFGLVAIQCAARSLALAHELGHLMGLEHDRAGRVLGYEPAFPYAFGYRHPDDQFRTIMATETACQQRCPSVPYFSNPDKALEGRPLGIDETDPESANNALALEQTMPIMATFRQAALPAVLVKSFAADRTAVELGQSATLTWETEGATSVLLSGAPVAPSGSMTVTPAQSTTYTLTAVSGEVTISSSVRVVVNCGGTPCTTSKRRSVRH